MDDGGKHNHHIHQIEDLTAPDITPQDVALMVMAFVLTLPWVVVRIYGVQLDTLHVVVLSGLSIVGAAFILSWAAEVAQLDISPSLALIFLALVAVLPEYAIDMYYAWGAGHAMQTWLPGTPYPLEFGLPMANMTGGNRLLIGLGWSMVALIYCFRSGERELDLEESLSLEFSFLLVATLYSFLIPVKGSLSVWDSAVYVLLFLLYARKAMQAGVQDTELDGPSAVIARLPVWPRRAATASLFFFSCVAIGLAAEPFAGGLKEIGQRFHLETFLLVQWVAPLASESPEFIVAALFAMRGAAAMGIGALISSKVNQWTLLVGMIPLAVLAASHGALGLPLDQRQREELLLTSAQSVFALAVIGNLRITRIEAMVLAVLFVTQLALPSERWLFCILYIVGAFIIFARQDWRKIFVMVGRHLLR
jgi:cation:H+ antiporter